MHQANANQERTGWLFRMGQDVTPEHVVAAIHGGEGVLISQFPVDSGRMLGFLTTIGRPLTEYARLIPEEQSGAPVGVNVVKLRERSDGGRTHHRSGELVPHSARSWAHERPRYFALLMVNSGWRDSAPGRNGESLFVPWRGALERMRKDDPTRFEMAFRLLSEIPVSFEADHVREAISQRPIIYPLPDSRDDLDVGVRVKQDLPLVLRRMAVVEDLANAVEWLQASARQLAHEKLAILNNGDLVVLDNNRWAHGRCEFEVARGSALNPREVWSIAIA